MDLPLRSSKDDEPLMAALKIRLNYLKNSQLGTSRFSEANAWTQFEIVKHVHHLMSGDELERRFGIGEGIVGDEGEERRAMVLSRRLQEAVALASLFCLDFFFP
ncbi:hypothetical protein PanWU01x14_217430 [Parasponia andersonii]|uniref:Uncharacterized protein n=1 Tax=Parasponia andersonii TaxID=3476 RepID=A0A2P5BRB6_PARAD|nr:hypothetical protein PanWU01x14_217430 [Parasponia andersonii]